MTTRMTQPSGDWQQWRSETDTRVGKLSGEMEALLGFFRILGEETRTPAVPAAYTAAAAVQARRRAMHVVGGTEAR
jgi:hypothetical protein